MSSTNKSEYLGLNMWAGTDVPKRTDFNSDNLIVDNAFKNHESNDVMHVNQTERNTWNMPYYANVYYGNGASSREIETNCPFEPAFGIIFANAAPVRVTYFDSKLSYNYMAFVAKRANSSGASLSGTTLTVKQSTSPVKEKEVACLNATATTYYYILFR